MILSKRKNLANSLWFYTIQSVKGKENLKLESEKVTVFNKLSNNEGANADIAKLNMEERARGAK